MSTFVLAGAIAAGVLMVAWDPLAAVAAKFFRGAIPTPPPDEPPANDRYANLSHLLAIRDALADDPACVSAIDSVLLPAVLARSSK